MCDVFDGCVVFVWCLLLFAYVSFRVVCSLFVCVCLVFSLFSVVVCCGVLVCSFVWSSSLEVSC